MFWVIFLVYLSPCHLYCCDSQYGVLKSILIFNWCQNAFEEGGKLYGKKVYLFGSSERKLLTRFLFLLISFLFSFVYYLYLMFHKQSLSYAFVEFVIVSLLWHLYILFCFFFLIKIYPIFCLLQRNWSLSKERIKLSAFQLWWL